MPPDKPAHRVVLADFVTIEDGTGLVHIAPAFGADDMSLAQEEDLPILMTVAADGTFMPDVRPWAAIFVKDADPFITQDLKIARVAVPALRRSPIPTRSAGAATRRLLYYARPTWYIRTSQFKDRLVAIEPEHQLVSRAHQERALWQLAGEQYRLGAGARALLGHTAAGVGMRSLPPRR